jgi:hypothetical protein
MIPVEAWRLLHLFFAFAFVGTLVVCDWNSRAARATEDWSQRALLWEIVRKAAGTGLGALLLLGLLGNLLSTFVGYRMSVDGWPRWVNGLWLVSLIVQGVVVAPGAARLANLSKAAAGASQPEGYAAALGRWRLGNLLQSLLYLALLVLMAFRWRS